MTKRKLRKKAENSPPQSPHDGIHTCSKGCKKPGCNRALRDTIEEQNKQIEALKRDLLEQAAAARHLRFERVHDLNHIGGQDEEIASLRSVAEDNKRECEATRIENARLKAEVERLNSELHTCSCANAKMNMHMNENARLKAEVEWLTKAGDAMAKLLSCCGNQHEFRGWNAAKEGKQP